MITWDNDALGSFMQGILNCSPRARMNARPAIMASIENVKKLETQPVERIRCNTCQSWGSFEADTFDEFITGLCTLFVVLAMVFNIEDAGNSKCVSGFEDLSFASDILDSTIFNYTKPCHLQDVLNLVVNGQDQYPPSTRSLWGEDEENLPWTKKEEPVFDDFDMRLNAAVSQWFTTRGVSTPNPVDPQDLTIALAEYKDAAIHTALNQLIRQFIKQ